MEERPGKGQQQEKSLSHVSSRRVPSTASRKAGGSLLWVSREMLKAGWGHPGKELDLICQLLETVSWVGDNCLDQIQLRQSTADISPGFRWGKEGDWVNLSFKATQISAICVCLMPRSTQPPLEGRGWFCQGEMLLEKCGLVLMFLTSPWAE